MSVQRLLAAAVWLWRRISRREVLEQSFDAALVHLFSRLILITVSAVLAGGAYLVLSPAPTTDAGWMPTIVRER